MNIWRVYNYILATGMSFFIIILLITGDDATERLIFASGVWAGLILASAIYHFFNRGVSPELQRKRKQHDELFVTE